MKDIADKTILEVKEVSKFFGGLGALNQVSFSVPQAGIVALIGPNGSGKTTLLSVISGLLPSSGGEVLFKKQRVNGLPPHHIAAMGIYQTFQDLRLFGNMSVLENAMVGCHRVSRANLAGVGLRLPYARREEKAIFKAAMSQLALVGLQEKAWDYPPSLSLGQRKLLAFARVLVAEPELLLLDEPTAGLSAREAEQLGEWILRVQQSGVTILLVEHRMDVVMSLAHKVVVLSYGKKIAEGAPVEIQRDKQVIAAYLGEEVESR